GDYRWINRGGVDLLGANPQAPSSLLGLPRARDLYGPAPEQLKDENSFASQLKHLLALRKQYKIEESKLVAVPEVNQPAVCVLIMEASDRSATYITAANFARQAVKVEIDFGHVKEFSSDSFAGRDVYSVSDGRTDGRIDDGGRLKAELDAWSAKL